MGEMRGLTHERPAAPSPLSGESAISTRPPPLLTYTGLTSAMIMRLTGIGSQYLVNPATRAITPAAEANADGSTVYFKPTGEHGQQDSNRIDKPKT